MRSMVRSRSLRQGWLWGAGRQVMENRLPFICVVWVMACSWVATVQASDFRVSYAEPLTLQQPTAPGQQKPAASRGTRLTAFGRNFDLVLEDNGRLLRKISPAAHRKIAATTLLRGTVKDAPGSWVRLSLSNGAYEGAIWDGNELYLIEARATLASALQDPKRDAAARSFIYRFSDTQGGLGARSCALDASAQPVSKGLSGYRKVITELQSAASAQPAAGTREIEVSMVGDYEFTSQEGPNALARMVSLMNVVDGIFSSQVGVSIVPTDFTTFAVDNDPFMGTVPQTLLNELAAFRVASPVLRSRGITHLLTGRGLLDTTVGIAFLGSLCDASTSVSLSESSHNMDSALIIAHELGHNFGAPHDGEGGSACASMPRSFLMSPTQNGSSTFSDCSLEKMQPYIAGASCIVNARIRDVAVTVPAAEIQTVVNQSFDFAADITSVGQAAAGNILVSASVPFVVENASLQGVACAVTASLSAPTVVNCEIAQLAVGESRRLAIRAHGTDAVSALITTQVTSTNDSVSANNSISVPVIVAADLDLRITATPQPLNVVKGQPFDVDVAVTASGNQTISDVRATFGVPPTILAADVVGGSACVLTSPVTCQLGTIAASETRHIHLQIESNGVGAGSLFVEAASQTGPPISRFVFLDLTTQAVRDISLELTPSSRGLLAVGADAPYSLAVKSNGVQQVDNVEVRIGSDDPALVVAIDGALASVCTAGSGVQICNLGTIAAGAQQTIQFRVHSGQPLTTSISARVVLASPDDNLFNDHVEAALDVRDAIEVSVQAGSPQTPYDQLPATMSVEIGSIGANPTDSVTASVSLPDGFSIQSAQLADGQCAVHGAVANCSILRMSPGSSAFIAIGYTAPTPGMYMGNATVSASGDTNPANNSAALVFNVLPAVDGKVAVPASTTAITDQPADLVFNVESNRYSLVDARLELTWFATLSEVTVVSQVGTCVVTNNKAGCDLGLVPPNTTVPVTLRLRSATQQQVSLSAYLTSASDVETSNNIGQLGVMVYDPGDAALSVAAASFTATATQSFVLPAADITVSSALANAFVDFVFDPSRASMDSSSGVPCSFLISFWRCQLGNMAAGETRRISLSLVPQSAGTFPVTVRVGGANDVNASNNEQVINVAVQSAPAPPPPVTPPAGGSSGGGGGGSMDWRSVLALFSLLAAIRGSRARRSTALDPRLRLGRLLQLLVRVAS